MMPTLRSRLAKIVFGIAFAGLAGTWAVGTTMSDREQPSKDSKALTRLTSKMKSVCVGRFLIDVPKETEVEFGQARVDGINIATFGEDLEEFHRRLAEREVQLDAIPDRLGGNKNLERSKEVKTAGGLEGKIFVHGRTVTEGTQGSGLGVERYRYEGVTVEALVHGNGISIDLSSAGRGVEWIDDIHALVDQLVTNPDNDIPAEPGFCIDRAYIREPLTADQREAIMMFARLPGHPDVDFMLILGAGLKPDEQGLLERSNEALARRPFAEKMRITQLRSAPRKISSLSGDELVEQIVEKNDAKVHSFWWEVNGTRDNVLVPHLVFKMSTGNSADGPVQSSLSGDAAVGLWDAITSSIRIRPIQSAGSDEAQVPLRTHADTGEPCPALGWWRREESPALDGTGWFAQGSPLPPATFTAAQGVVCRSSHLSKAIQRRSAWHPMRVAAAPPPVDQHLENTRPGARHPPPAAQPG